MFAYDTGKVKGTRLYGPGHLPKEVTLALNGFSLTVWRNNFHLMIYLWLYVKPKVDTITPAVLNWTLSSGTSGHYHKAQIHCLLFGLSFLPKVSERSVWCVPVSIGLTALLFLPAWQVIAAAVSGQAMPMCWLLSPWHYLTAKSLSFHIHTDWRQLLLWENTCNSAT